MDYEIGSIDGFKHVTDPGVHNISIDSNDLCSLWTMCASDYSDKIALEYEGSRLTYRELDDQISVFRTVLKEYGCKKGDRIAILASNSIDCVRSLFATVTLGCVAVMLPPDLDVNRIENIRNDFALSAIVYQPKYEDAIGELKAGHPDHVFINASEKRTAKTPAAVPDTEDPCLILFTGGTTGIPKGALLSHRAVVRGIKNGAIGIGNIEKQRFLLLLPLFHVYGLFINLLICFYIGGHLYISSSEKDLIRDIKEFKPTIISFVPALAEVALKLSRQLEGPVFNPEFRTGFIGGTDVPQYLVEEYAKLGVNLYPGYGMTEASDLILGNPNPLEKPNSVGIPYPYEEIKIVNGELWARGENFLTDYIGTDECAWNNEGWFQTGDLARIDEDGYVYLLGRIKDVIILQNGTNIYPSVLEARFNDLPFVKDCEVYAERSGNEEFLALDVVLRDTTESKKAILDELWDINNKQTSTEVVRKIHIREEDFERTANKKIVRRKIGQS